MILSLFSAKVLKVPFPPHEVLIYFNASDMDVLENVEIGEQKQRDMAYKAAKKKTGVYDDK